VKPLEKRGDESGAIGGLSSEEERREAEQRDVSTLKLVTISHGSYGFCVLPNWECGKTQATNHPLRRILVESLFQENVKFTSHAKKPLLSCYCY
jgi:hypothetical protein